MKILALDVGGTAIKSAFVAEDGSLSAYTTTPSAPNPPEKLTQAAIAVANTYDDYDVLAVAMTGQINHHRQITLARSNGQSYERAQFPVGQILREATGKPVFVLNDANAAAYGDACLGAGRDFKDFVCLTYGTGVGGGIIQNRQLFSGHRGIAGELGHMVVHAGGLRCRCGHLGCYQEYASTTALLREARQVCPELQNARQLFDRLPQVPALRPIVDSWIREIAEGLCSLAYILDPPCFVLGGGVMERPDILEQVRQQFQNRVIPSFSDIEIRKAQLGNQAGIIGAASFARHELKKQGGI